MLDRIVGHRHQVDYLKRILENKEYLHAYLFEGESGIGKKTIAMEMSKAILCETEEDSLLFDAGNFNDLLVILPQDNQIKVEEVKRIQEFLISAPARAKKKIVIIDDSDKMNLIAQNKILKIIEEPPKYAMFFLITNNRNALIDTLLSRLIKVSFNALREEDLNLYVEKNHIKYDKNISILSNGSIGRYLELLDSKDQGLFDFVMRLREGLKTKNTLKIFECVQEAEGYSDNLYEFLDVLEYVAETFLNIGTGRQDGTNGGISEHESTEDAEKVANYMRIIGETRYRFLRNQNKKLLIANLIYRMQGVFK